MLSVFCNIDAKPKKLSDNLTWEIKDGCLYILGSGRMPDFNAEKLPPWAKQKMSNQIYSITLEEGVKSIGDFSFYCPDGGYTHLVEVSLPSSLESIGEKAFYRSPILEIKFPDNLKRVGEECFAHSKIRSARFPDSIERIEDGVFRCCQNLKDITGLLPKLITDVPTAMFSDCDALTKITLPRHIIAIKGSAFYDCDKLSKVLFQCREIEFIGYRAFGSCDVLSEIPFETLAKLHTIGNEAFSDCALRELDFKDALRLIGYRSFANNPIEIVNMPDCEIKISSKAFYGIAAKGKNQVIRFSSKAILDGEIFGWWNKGYVLEMTECNRYEGKITNLPEYVNDDNSFDYGIPTDVFIKYRSEYNPTAEDFLDKGFDLYIAGDYEEAISNLKRAEGMGFKSKQIVVAFSGGQSYNSKDYNNNLLYYTMGMCYLRLENKNEASACFHKVIPQRVPTLRHWYLLAREEIAAIAKSNGQYEYALLVYEELKEDPEKQSEVFQNYLEVMIGECYQGMGHYKEAISWYKKSLMGEGAIGHYNLANLYLSGCAGAQDVQMVKSLYKEAAKKGFIVSSDAEIEEKMRKISTSLHAKESRESSSPSSNAHVRNAKNSRANRPLPFSLAYCLDGTTQNISTREIIRQSPVVGYLTFYDDKIRVDNEVYKYMETKDGVRIFQGPTVHAHGGTSVPLLFVNPDYNIINLFFTVKNGAGKNVGTLRSVVYLMEVDEFNTLWSQNGGISTNLFVTNSDISHTEDVSNYSSSGGSKSYYSSNYGWKDCHFCGGSGYCPTCHGDGIMDAGFGNGSTSCANCSTTSTRKGVCSVCQGKGKVFGIKY